jgi:two-component sensor histidine kinase
MADASRPANSLDLRESIKAYSRAADVAIGAALGAFLVASRYWLPVDPNVLPVAAIFVALPFVTMFRGWLGGLAEAVVGLAGSWYFVLVPQWSWALDEKGLLILVGNALIAAIIITSSQMYRRSERRYRHAVVVRAERDLAERDLFARELNHRVKNSLTIVQSLAAQTFDRSDIRLTLFAGRVKALADAQALLMPHTRYPIAEVAEVVEAALEPFASINNFDVTGPAAKVRDQEAVNLALALHELGTNAVKYGALSVASGSVEVRWSKTENELHLEWDEHGGPEVTPPHKQGFGTRLLNRRAMGTQIEFRPGGLHCRIVQRLA